jgi:TolA-binding protein
MSAENAKLSKDELKEDEFIESVMRAVDYVRRHAQYFIAGLAAVVVVVLIGSYVMHSQEQAREDAAGMLGDALIAEDGGQTDQAVTLSQQLVAKYDGTPAAAQGLLMLANRRFAQSNFGEARGLYQRALSEAGENSVLRFAARSGLAACTDAEGNTQGAAAEYEKYAAEFPGTAESAQALMAAARCYRRLGQRDAEKGVLQRVVREYTELPAAAQARSLLESY